MDANRFDSALSANAIGGQPQIKSKTSVTSLGIFRSHLVVASSGQTYWMRSKPLCRTLDSIFEISNPKGSRSPKWNPVLELRLIGLEINIEDQCLHVSSTRMCEKTFGPNCQTKSHYCLVGTLNVIGDPSR